MNSSSDNKYIYFRVDFGGLIGRGHLSRCLSLAEVFSSNGYYPIFIIRKRPSIENEILPFNILWLTKAPDVTSANTDSWSVGTPESEARELLEVVDENSLIVLDHYGLGLSFQKKLEGKKHTIVLFQDIFNEDFVANILINYNLNAGDIYTESFKKSRNTKFIIGAKYTPLSSVYASECAIRFQESMIISSVGVYLGGVNLKDLEAIARLIKNSTFFINKKIEWVVNSEQEKLFLEKFLVNLDIVLHVRLPSMIALYKRVQLFIGTCGVAFLERACMGIWQMNFIVANNQKPLGTYLLNKNLAKNIVNLLECTEESARDIFETNLNEPAQSVKNSIHNLNQLINANGAHEIYREVVGYKENAV